MTVADHNVTATEYIHHETEWLNKPPVTLTDYNVKVAKQNMTVAEHNVTVAIQQFSVQYTRQEFSRWKLRVWNMLPWHPLELLREAEATRGCAHRQIQQVDLADFRLEDGVAHGLGT